MTTLQDEYSSKMKEMEESLVRVKEIEELIPYIKGIELREYYHHPHYCGDSIRVKKCSC